MRFYSVAVVSLTAQAPTKWTDNLLSQHSVPGVAHRERGVARGVSWNALVRIALIRMLSQELGCGVREALQLAAALLDGSPGPLQISSFLTLRFDRVALEATLQDRLKEAIESAPRPRRGRPRRRSSRES